jgi:hypothetical protein
MNRTVTLVEANAADKLLEEELEEARDTMCDVARRAAARGRSAHLP